MVRILLALAVGAGVGGVTLAHDRENAKAVKVLSARDVKEKLDGKEAKATVVEVTLDHPANVQLLDPVNYNAYRDGRPFRYVGGHVTTTPVRLRPPQPSQVNRP